VSTRPLIALTCQRLEPGRVWKLEPALAVISDYVDAIWRAGGFPVPVFPLGSPETEAAEVLDHADGVVLIGGFDVDPSRYGQERHETTQAAPVDQEEFELALLRSALERGTPTFCICRGFQLLNVALGGSLDQHIGGQPGRDLHGIPNGGGGQSNAVKLEPGSLAEHVMSTAAGGGEVVGRCHHHQAVADVAPGLVVTGRTADGTVEVLERAEPGSWLLGVQWHPEETAATDPQNQALFDHLVAAARR
jgi:gamma-glutamyl-gamma-aminobutyrate hydrolase PuuD